MEQQENNMKNRIHYRKLSKEERGGKSYKYELIKNYVQTGIDLGNLSIIEKYYHYYDSIHRLIIYKGYRWDGSTVALDTEHCMRASLVHDVLYQLFREGLLDLSYRKQADKLYKDIMIEDGANKWWAGTRYRCLRIKAGWDSIRRRK